MSADLLTNDILHGDNWRMIFRRSPHFDQVLRDLRIFLGDPSRKHVRVPSYAEISGYTNWNHPEPLRQHKLHHVRD
jgi:hypothetical protein